MGLISLCENVYVCGAMAKPGRSENIASLFADSA